MNNQEIVYLSETPIAVINWLVIRFKTFEHGKKWLNKTSFNESVKIYTNILA